MQGFRNINILEALHILNTGFVMPKMFVKNPDSTAKSGKKSFWLDEFKQIHPAYSEFIVSGTLTGYEKSVMTISETDIDDYTHTYEVSEYTTASPVDVEKIWIEKILKQEILKAAKKENLKKETWNLEFFWMNFIDTDQGYPNLTDTLDFIENIKHLDTFNMATIGTI